MTMRALLFIALTLGQLPSLACKRDCLHVHTHKLNSDEFGDTGRYACVKNEKDFKKRFLNGNPADPEADPCFSCVGGGESHYSPDMSEAVCLAGYRSKYCQYTTFSCLGIRGLQPGFCDRAIQKGLKLTGGEYKMDNICQKRADTSHIKRERSEEDVARFKKELQNKLGEGKMVRAIESLTTKEGKACLAHTSGDECNSAKDGCIYYGSLRTDAAARAVLVNTLGFEGEDVALLDLQFSWNTGCVPKHASVPSTTGSPEKLEWKDDSCFLNSALFSFFGQLDDAIPFLASQPKEEDGCGEFIRAGVRNVVARMRTARSVNYDRFVGLLRKGLPVACHELMEAHGMQEIAMKGSGNYLTAAKILLMAMGFEIGNAEIKSGVELYKARHSNSDTPETDVSVAFSKDFSLIKDDVTLMVGEDNMLRQANGSLFTSPVYGTLLLLGPEKQGLEAKYELEMGNLLKDGKCKDSFSACIVHAFQGHTLVFPPKFIVISVDIKPEYRDEAMKVMPKDFGAGFVISPALLESCGDCKAPTYALRSFGTATEIHQTAFSRSGTLNGAWVFHNDMGSTHVWAHETADPYDVSYDTLSLRGNSTTLLYQIDMTPELKKVDVEGGPKSSTKPAAKSASGFMYMIGLTGIGLCVV